MGSEGRVCLVSIRLPVPFDFPFASLCFPICLPAGVLWFLVEGCYHLPVSGLHGFQEGSRQELENKHVTNGWGDNPVRGDLIQRPPARPRSTGGAPGGPDLFAAGEGGGGAGGGRRGEGAGVPGGEVPAAAAAGGATGEPSELSGMGQNGVDGFQWMVWFLLCWTWPMETGFWCFFFVFFVFRANKSFIDLVGWGGGLGGGRLGLKPVEPLEAQRRWGVCFHLVGLETFFLCVVGLALHGLQRVGPSRRPRETSQRRSRGPAQWSPTSSSWKRKRSRPLQKRHRRRGLPSE